IVSCGFAVGEKFGAVFVPEAGDYPFTIDEVQFMLTPYSQGSTSCEEQTAGDFTVTVEIWNDDAPSVDPPRPPVYQSTDWSVTTSTTALNVLDIAGDREVLVESGVVRVAVTIPAIDAMPVRDIDGITAERNLIHLDSGSWSWSEDLGLTGDWLVRLVVIPQESDEVEPVPDASDDPAVDPVDAADDVPADLETDTQQDVQDEGDGSLSGGGCGCVLAGGAGPASLLPLLLVLLSLCLPGRLSRR
ncbi:MAG: hypothetical protein JRG91_21165, partial [Deltaproteobacteria bacterium]|nr:hypothetical protein [Deltaproteobacteria bacterium]